MKGTYIVESSYLVESIAEGVALIHGVAFEGIADDVMY